MLRGKLDLVFRSPKACSSIHRLCKWAHPESSVLLTTPVRGETFWVSGKRFGVRRPGSTPSYASESALALNGLFYFSGAWFSIQRSTVSSSKGPI